MPRRGPIPTRRLAPDPLYGSTLVTQVTNRVMRDGKKTLAQKIVYEVNGTGAAVKRRDDIHRQAEANRAFAHYRW